MLGLSFHDEDDRCLSTARSRASFGDSRPAGRLLRYWELEGGVSARTVAVEFEYGDGLPETVVVRLHGEVDRERNPNIAADEFRLHQLLQRSGIPVPTPIYLDTRCECFEIPSLVVSFVDGTPEPGIGNITQMASMVAEQLAAIHDVDLDEDDLAFLPDQSGNVDRRLRQRPRQLDDRLREDRIRDALESLWPPAPANFPSLLHGDYWPGNLLWRDGEIAAVIDWEDAATGDPLADVANARLELLWASGDDAMDAFTEQYWKLMPKLDNTDLPYWDLYAALQPCGKLWNWGLEAEVEATMIEAHQRFVDRALSGGPHP